MVEILSQAEIEALLATLSGDGDEAASLGAASPAPAEPGPVAADEVRLGPRGEPRSMAYELYDFRRPDKFAKDQMRTLQMLHETFARLFASSLSAYLRVSTHVDLISVEQVPYDEYTRSLTSSIINVFSMAPLQGQAILEMEFNIVLAMIDRLLGGPGNMAKSTTVLTEIEQALTESIITRAHHDLRLAWEGVARFSPRSERIETQAQFIQIVPPNDIVVSILFEAKVGDLRGAMSLCIPYVVLKPIAQKFSAQRWFSTGSRKAFGQEAVTIARQIETTSVECVCTLGHAQITVGELVQLDVGDTIVLDRKSTDELDLLIGEKPKFKGRPGSSGRKVALHINRVCGEEAAHAA